MRYSFHDLTGSFSKLKSNPWDKSCLDLICFSLVPEHSAVKHHTQPKEK